MSGECLGNWLDAGINLIYVPSRVGIFFSYAIADGFLRTSLVTFKSGFWNLSVLPTTDTDATIPYSCGGIEATDATVLSFVLSHACY